MSMRRLNARQPFDGGQQTEPSRCSGVFHVNKLDWSNSGDKADESNA
jgi:hypothetical protein